MRKINPPLPPLNWRKVELLTNFTAFPLMLAILKPHGWIYIALWVIAALALRILRKEDPYSLRAEWNWAAVTRPVLTRMFLRFVPIAIMLFGFTWFMVPDKLFNLLQRPQLWVMVMVFYPLLSAIPQEFIFRSYFFKRFAPVFTTPRGMMIASALAFGWVHIVLRNWVAVVFSGIAGLLFADTYARTQSLAAAWLEHALYGCFIFTLGLGVFFYHGQAVH